jgi:hypothetical protein
MSDGWNGQKSKSVAKLWQRADAIWGCDVTVVSCRVAGTPPNNGDCDKTCRLRRPLVTVRKRPGFALFGNTGDTVEAKGQMVSGQPHDVLCLFDSWHSRNEERLVCLEKQWIEHKNERSGRKRCPAELDDVLSKVKSSLSRRTRRVKKKTVR